MHRNTELRNLDRGEYAHCFEHRSPVGFVKKDPSKSIFELSQFVLTRDQVFEILSILYPYSTENELMTLIQEKYNKAA